MNGEISMSYKSVVNLGLISASLMILTACGGGALTSSPVITPPPVADTPPPTLLTASANQAIAKISVSDLNGTTTIGALNLTGARAQDYSAILANGDVVGLVTLAGDAPTSGTLTYAGSSYAEIIDPTDFYNLEGQATAVLTLASGSGSLNVTLDGMSGRKNLGSVQSYPNIKVVLNGASLCNGVQFCGGTASVQGLTTTLSGSETMSNLITLFGQNGEELGGMILISDGSNLDVTSAFVAAK
jgi:hypothetical protein